MTVAEIKAELDALGIEYDNRMLKSELLDLLNEHQVTYKVIFKFKDLQDNNHRYKVGDIYPREGLEVSQKRIDELSSYKNKIGKQLIKERD